MHFATPYQPRDATGTILFGCVSLHWPRVARQAGRWGHPLPGFVHREFESYLKCGLLDHGFARIHCHGAITHPDSGSPQGGVISPLLSNIYLHEVLDLWFEHEVKPRLKGQAFLVRYADDFVMGFAREADAHRVMAVLPKRFERYGLTLHPEKTRMLGFRSPRDRKDPGDDDGPGNFDFLGFTHHWEKSRKGFWVVRQKTSKSRFTRALQRIKEWCRTNRHLPVREQQEALSRKMKGHYGYYGGTGNTMCLGRFRNEVGKLWKKWLSRRSQRASLDWPAFNRLLKRYPLPNPRVVHSIYRYAANP